MCNIGLRMEYSVTLQMLERVRMHIHRGVTLPFPKLENHFCATLPVIE